MSGRPRSSRTRSGRWLSQRSSAERPSAASVDPVAAAGQLADERGARLGVVLDDQDRSVRSASAPASLTRSPRPRRRAGQRGRGEVDVDREAAELAAPRRHGPPIASTRPRTTARPMPVPEREPPATPGTR